MVDTNKLLGAVINDRYRVVKLVGKGGSGYVYKAVNVETDEEVALKILKDVMADDDESVIRFEKEVAVSAKLTNAHTIRVHEFGKTVEGYLLIVMEFLKGRSLTDMIRESAPLSPKRAAGLVQQVLEALAEAHELGIVHRDLKPDNIFLIEEEESNGDDFVKVLDFGIAKFLHDDSVGDTLTRDGFVFGTPLYISPEQALGWQVSPASDIYSLGVLFFEMLTGDPPFTAETPIGLGMKHIYEPPPLDRIQVDQQHTGLKHLLSIMLEKRPERRPATAADALALFGNLEELTDTPFSIERATTVVHSSEAHNASPTVKAKPASEEEMGKYVQSASRGTVDEVVDAVHEEWPGEIPTGELHAPPEEESEAAEAPTPAEAGSENPENQKPDPVVEPQPAEEVPVETPSKRKKKRKKSRKKKKQQEQAQAQVQPEVQAEEAPRKAPGDPAIEVPMVDPKPSSAAPSEELPRRGSDAPGGPSPQRVREPEPTPEPTPEVQRPGPARDDSFSLFDDAPPGLAPSSYREQDIPVDDWRQPTRRRKGAGVGIFAWLVLLLGILMAAFVVYALVKGGESMPYGHGLPDLQAPDFLPAVGLFLPFRRRI